MTFEERCMKFEKNTENEINHFKKVYRVVFLEEKIKEHKKEEDFFEEPTARLGDLKKYKNMF